MERAWILLALLLVFAPAVAGASGAEGGAPEREPAAPAPAGADPVRVPGERVVVMDSSELPDQVQLESRPLQGQEMREIREISRHPGTTGQLLLWRPPWGGHVMWHPGASIPLETKKEKEEREAVRKQLEAGEETPAGPAAEGEESPADGPETGGERQPPTTP